MAAIQQSSAVLKPYPAAAIQKRTFIFGPLLLFTLSDLLLALIGEALKTHLVWYFRYTDLIDLALTAPLFLISFVWLEDQMVATNATPWLRRIFLILAMVFLYGHAMHVTANTVNTFSTEIRQYLPLIPADTYALLYFLDETLSHYIVDITRFGIFAIILMMDTMAKTGDQDNPWFKWAFVLGCLYGIWEAIVFTESQKVFLLPVLAIGLAILWLILWRRRGGKVTTFLRSGPMTAFVGGLVPFTLIGLLLYYLIIGGFTEPSQL